MSKSTGVLKIESWSLDAVHPYPKNPRVNEGSVDAVAASINEFGWQKPIVVDKKGVIICGHTCYAAAKKLGLLEVPVHVAENLSAAKVRAYRLVDNKAGESSFWDDVLLREEAAAVEGIDLSRFGFDLSELTSEETTLEPIDISKPPDMAWVLIGIPIVRYGEIASDVERIGGIEGIVIQTTANNGKLKKDG